MKPDSDWKRVLEDCPDSSCAVVFDEDEYLSYLKVRFVPDTERDLFTRRYVSQASKCAMYHKKWMKKSSGTGFRLRACIIQMRQNICRKLVVVEC